MSDVFVSYSRNDVDIVKALVAHLENTGFSVDWDDSFQIAAGATLTNLIDARCKISGCVLVLWSESSIESKWVTSEAQIGKKRGRLLQTTIDGTKPPFEFSRYIYGSLEGWDRTSNHSGLEEIENGIRFFHERNRLKLPYLSRMANKVLQWTRSLTRPRR